MKTLRAGAALAAAAALALSACATNETTTTPSATGNGSAPAGSLSGTIQGIGASSMRAAQEVWRAEFQTANPDVTVNYSPDGSGASRTAFTEGAADFAGSDRAFKDDEMSGAFTDCATGTSPLNLPIYISPIGIIFNVDGVDELHLSAPVIAQIFTGQITKWNDPAIAALNAGVTFPDQTIAPVHRSDDSGTTENFTETLSQVAPDVWTFEPDGEWPAELGGEGGSQTTGVVSAVQIGTGTIGYADVSGVPEGMTMARYSIDGTAYVGPTPEEAVEVVNASEQVAGRGTHDWALELNRTASGYPFVLVSYALACQDYADDAKGELVQAYLAYVASEEGQKAAQPQAGNAPLTGELAENVRAAVASIS